jgi:hypothetical protein
MKRMTDPNLTDYTRDAVAATDTGTGGSDNANEHVYYSILGPSNNSGVTGAVRLALDDHSLSVDLVANGLTPGVEHASHIHGLPDGEPSQTPTIALDADHDGFVEDPEGEPVVGPVLLALTEQSPPNNAVTGVDFPVADQNGHLELHRTFNFNLDDPEQTQIFQALSDHLEGRAVQLHGLDLPAGYGAGTPNEVNGQGGYIDTLPVADGLIHETHDPNVLALLDTLHQNGHAADCGSDGYLLG